VIAVDERDQRCLAGEHGGLRCLEEADALHRGEVAVGVDRHRDRRLRRAPSRLAGREELGFQEHAGRAPAHHDGLAPGRPAVSHRAIFQIGERD